MISSRQNRRIKTIRSLRDCKESYAFLEGPRLAAECHGSEVEVVEVLATPEFLDEARSSSTAAALSSEPLVVSEAVLASLTDAVSPQGIVVVAHLPRARVEVLPLVEGGIYLMLDGLQDPGNLGALVRSAEATGISGIAVSSGSAHPNHPKALRASAGSLLRMPMAREVAAEELVAHLAPVSPTLVGLDARGGTDLYRTRLEGSLVLALGSEGGGLSPTLRSRLDRLISIPSAAPVESLNVAVAGSVVLHELARRRRE